MEFFVLMLLFFMALGGFIVEHSKTGAKFIRWFGIKCFDIDTETLEN